MLSEQNLFEMIRAQLDDMFPAERKAAEYILAHPEESAQLSITELAEHSGSSDATIIRTCKRLGFTGFYQMKLRLASDLGYIQLLGQQPQTSGRMDIPEIFKTLARSTIGMENNIDPQKISAVVNLLKNSRHVYLAAAGNSIPCAMDFSFRLARLGIRTSCNPVVENMLNDIALGQKDELVVVISHSGSSKHVLAAMELAKDREMNSVILTHSSGNSAAQLADYCILTQPSAPLFHNYGIASHLFDNVIIDLLLYLLSCSIHEQTAPDQMEMVLSEFKI